MRNEAARTESGSASIARGFVSSIASRIETHVLLSVAILFLDLVTGRYLQFPILFVVPVALAAWYGNYRLAYTLAILLPIGRLLIALFVDTPSPSWYIAANCLIRIAVLLFIAYMSTRVTQQTKQLTRSREQLKSMSQRLLEVQEEERRYLARELHDEMGQNLTLLKLMLDMALSRASPANSSTLPEAVRLVDDLISRVRRLSLDLRPPILDDLGLIPGLLWLFERRESTLGVRVDFHVHGMEERLPSELEGTLYRITQEALTNAARHAGTREITVNLRRHVSKVSLEVVDRGTGFDIDAVLSERRSSGLTGMQERTALLGGTLIIDSEPGRGTSITAEFPI